MKSFTSSALGAPHDYRAWFVDTVCLLATEKAGNGGQLACRDAGSDDPYSNIWHDPDQVKQVLLDYDNASVKEGHKFKVPGDQGSFVISMALGMLGLTDAQEKTVEAAVPDATALVDLVNQNANVINQVVGLINDAMPHVQAILPAAQIVADALERQAQSQAQTGD